MIWILVLPFAAWAVLRVLGVEPVWQWVPLVAFTPYVAALALVPLGVAALTRRWAATAVAGLACLALAWCVLPRALPGTEAGGGRTLRVLAANVMVGRADPAQLVELVRRVRPDALALQELTPELRARMEELGLRDLLPHAVDRSAPGVSGSAVYARYPVRELPLIEHGSFRQTRAVLALPGGEPVEVVSVHPCAPRYDARVTCWAQGLDALPRAGGTPRVLAGDFNATLDHAPMRALLAGGYLDAADATGQGFTHTWPNLGWRMLPGVTIDHVLVWGGSVAAFAVHDLKGTDHRPVYGELRLR